MFYVNGEGVIVPAQNPDDISLSDLYDYERAAKQFIDGIVAGSITDIK